MRSSVHTYYYLLALGVFLILCGPALFSDGMFMDGLFYATVARNMAEGYGTFWKPYLAEAYYPEFYEHPPLAFGLQAILFKIFGDSIYVERFYALGCFLFTAYLIVLLWKELGHTLKTGWIPLLLYALVTIVPWAYANNMLENTMGVFVCLSALLFFKSLKKYSFLYLSLCGFSLSAAFLSKGLVCLYIWALPFFYWLILRKNNFSKMLSQSVLIVYATLIPLALLYFFSAPAAESISRYIGDQLIHSLDKVVTVDSRLYIIGQFLQNILIPLAVGLIFLFIYYLKHRSLNLLKHSDLKMASILGLLILAGVLPIMISLKQRGFYILTVYPFFAIALALMIEPIMLKLTEKLSQKPVKIICGLVFTVSIILCFSQIGRTGRDTIRISDIKKVVEKVGENESIVIYPYMYTDWSLHGYFMRYGYVSLDTNRLHHNYHLVPYDFTDLLLAYSCDTALYSLRNYTLYECEELKQTFLMENELDKYYRFKKGLKY